MKRSVYFILIIFLAFALNACSANMDESEDFYFDDFLSKWDITYYNVCSSVTDAVKYPVPWNEDVDRAFVIPLETIRSMSTCGLLETMLTNPSFYTYDKSELRLAPWYLWWYPDSIFVFHNNHITKFNDQLTKDPMAVELFNRNDCFPVLASKYLTFIKEIKEKEIPLDYQPSSTCTLRSTYFPYFEMLLASDLCMSALNETEINQIMAMALAYEEKADLYCCGYFVSETYTIMITIMLWCNYPPFIEEVAPRLFESYVGYGLTDTDGAVTSTIFVNTISERDDIYLILKHAKNFLTEQKL